MPARSSTPDAQQQLLRIEEALGAYAEFPGRAVFRS
jgi:hypothetical protein